MAHYSTGGLPILLITLLLAHVLAILPATYNHGTFGPFVTFFPYGSAGHKEALCVTVVTHAGCAHQAVRTVATVRSTS